MSFQYKALGDLCDFQNGFVFKSKLFKDSGLPIIRITNIQDQIISTDKLVYFDPKNYKQDFEKYKVEPNDLLIAMSGATTGKIGFNNTNKTFYLNQRVGNLKPKQALNKKYLYYFLLTQVEKNLKKALGSAQPNLSTEQIKNLPLPFAPLPIQEKIVAKLDKIFAEIDKATLVAEANAKNTEILFKSYLNKLFDSDNKNWDKKKSKEISIYVGRGKSKHRPRDDKSLYGGIYPFIQTGDVRNSKKYITVYNQTYNEKGLSQSRLWKANTICITIAANIAEVGILSFDACFPDSLIGITVDQKKINEEFLYFMLLHKQQLIKSKSKGSAQENINLKTFEDMFFMVPQKDKQDKIVKQLNHLFKLSNSITNIQLKKVSELILLKQSILQQAFNGELGKAA